MAILEVTLTGTYFNQQTINRWNYVSTGIPAAVSLSYALAFAFGAVYDEVHIPPQYPTDAPLGVIAANFGDAWDWQQLTVLNVYSVTDFYQTPFVNPYGGQVAGNNMSPTAAAGFRTNQVRRDVARGTKRFPGLLETQVGAGGILEAVTQTALQAVADSMSATLSYDDEGNTISFAPAVCGKQEYDPNPTEPSRNHRAYKYYATESEQLAHTAVGVVWQAYAQQRTQNSRQYGKGR